MLLLVLALLLAPTAPAARWSRPAEGAVVRSFTYDARTPFERGARRGITFGAPRGSPVRAACAGIVRFAGSAGRNGRTVTVDCGPYATTYLGLSSIAVTERARVRRGARLGAAGRDGLRFGVRRRADRFAYLDPLTFLPPRSTPRRLPPLGRAPRGRAPRGTPPGARPPASGREPLRSPPPGVPLRAPPLPRPSSRTARRPGAGPTPTVPLVVWAGLVAVACGVVGAPVVRLRRRRRVQAAATLSPTWTSPWKSSR